MTYKIEIAAADVPGDLPAPAIVTVTFTTAPNRLFLRAARRTIGNPSNWKSTYEAESATSGDGTTPSHDADASGASNNFRHFTFGAVGDVKSCTWHETTNMADKVGRFDVYAIIKDQAAARGNFVCACDLKVGGVLARVGKDRAPQFSHLSGSAYECVYLDTFDVRDTPTPSSLDFIFRTHRTAGTDAVDLDRLVLLPSEALAALDWTSPADISASSAKTFTLDAYRRRGFYGTYATTAVDAKFTAGLFALPGVKNVFLFEPSADPAWVSGAASLVPKHTLDPIASVTIDLIPSLRR